MNPMIADNFCSSTWPSTNNLVKGLATILAFFFLLPFSCTNQHPENDGNFSKTDWTKVQEATNYEKYQSKTEPGLFREVFYYPSGKKNIEYFTLNGKKNGKETRWYENGAVQLEASFVNGSKEGEVIGYYENGTLHSKHEYKNDKKNGKAVYYFSNGNIKLDGYYLNDELSGIGKYYDENGNLIKTQNF